MKRVLIFLFIVFPFTLFSHGNEDHKKEKAASPIKTESPVQKSTHDSQMKSPTQKSEHDSQMKSSTPEASNAEAQEAKALQQINTAYQQSVKSIFADNCFNCHSDTVEYPCYYKYPIIKQLIDKDIEEAKEHLDMSNDFPFGGHGSPTEDLESLKTTVLDESMPPWRYTLMHRDSVLTEKEKQQIVEWIDNSQKLLN